MRYHLLQPVPGDNSLAELINQYLGGLHTPMSIVEPAYTTLAEVRQYLTEPFSPEASFYHSCAHNYYQYLILRQSLASIHGHVVEALELLDGFFSTEGNGYGGNLLSFAFNTRFEHIDQFGSDDPTDWCRDDEADESEPWKITLKEDAESLAPYSLRAELGRFFGSEHCGRGEYLGTSGPDDFAPYSVQVAGQSAFGLRRWAEVAGLALVQVQADGSTAPLSLGDQLEQELNEDLRGADVVARLNRVLSACQLARQRWSELPADEVQEYAALRELLRQVRDVDFGSLPD